MLKRLWSRKPSKNSTLPASETVAQNVRERKAKQQGDAGPPEGLKIARHNALRKSPANARFKLCVVQFKVAAHPNGGSDKGPDGNRIDSIPIANGVIAAGGACDLLLFDADKADAWFASVDGKYDAFIVRINPGQLSQGTPPGTQAAFDAFMKAQIAKGKLVWSSPEVQTKMGAKDALCKISNMGCGLVDTFAYYDAAELEAQFKKTAAFQPRVIKQNRGSAGEGIWLCWLEGKEYCKTFGEASLEDGDMLKLMEMNDNHVEYHTVKEFLTFCVDGPDAPGAGDWKSTFPGKYLEGGKAAGGQLVDQRLLPRIEEGEVRILMAGDTCQMLIHKKPEGGGLSAVGGNSAYTYYEPSDPKYADLLAKLYADIPSLLDALELSGEPLPLLWTADYIPKDPENPHPATGLNAAGLDTEYVVGEFNCSCVGVSKFQAVCGGDKTLADVSDEDYFEACKLTDLMGVKAIEMLEAFSGQGTNDGLCGKQPGIDPDFDLIMEESLAKNEYPAAKLEAARGAEHTSLAAKFCTPEVWAQYKDTKSSGKASWTLARAINTGVMYPSSFVGCHAGDRESYDDFKGFFYPVIEAYHKGFSMEKGSDLEGTAAERMDPAKVATKLSESAKAKIISTRIRVARNLSMFPLNPGGTRESREAIASLMAKVYAGLENAELQGDFFLHTTMSDEQRQALIDGHQLFRGKDKMQAASGYHADWPHGRGVYLNPAKSFVNWVNEGDHLRIISMQNGGNVEAVFARLSAGAAAIEAGVRKETGVAEGDEVFMMHPKFGAVTCCPSNIGTGMRGSVHILVPNLIKTMGFEAIDKLARARNCQARGSSGEHSEVVDRIDISNWRRIGFPEYELVNDMIMCANFLAEEEDKIRTLRRHVGSADDVLLSPEKQKESVIGSRF